MSETAQLDVKQIHDLLLVGKPSEASHDASLCPLCVASGDGTDPHTNDDTLGGDVTTTYTEDDLTKRVAEATADLRAELDALKQEQGLAELEDRLTEMTEAHEAKVTELQAEIDTAKAATEAAETQYQELVTLIDDAKAAEEAAEALEARKGEVKEAVASLFSEDHINANLDRWASMDVEAFEASVADWTAAAEAVKAKSDGKGGGGSGNGQVATAMESNSDNNGGDQERSVAEIRQSLFSQPDAVRSVGASSTGGIA